MADEAGGREIDKLDDARQSSVNNASEESPMMPQPQQQEAREAPQPHPSSHHHVSLTTGTTSASSSSARKAGRALDMPALQRLNWPFIDPPKWGWTAAGGIADVLPPHERARRPSTKRSYLVAHKRKRDRSGNLIGVSSLSTLDQNHHQTKTTTTQQKDGALASHKARAASVICDTTSSSTILEAGTCERTRHLVREPYHRSNSGNSQSLRRVMSSVEHNPLKPWKNSNPQIKQLQEFKAAAAVIQTGCSSLENLNGETTISGNAGILTNGQLKDRISVSNNDSSCRQEATEKNVDLDQSKSSSEEPGKLLPCQQHERIHLDDDKKDPMTRRSSETDSTINSKTNHGAVETMSHHGKGEAKQDSLQMDNTESTKAENATKNPLVDTAPTEERPLNGTRVLREKRRSKGQLKDSHINVAAKANANALKQQIKQTRNDPIRFKALCDADQTGTDGTPNVDDDPKLDIFTYHRGREGLELRDNETGNLLCDMPVPTDTNHKSEEPDTSLVIQIEFPLPDGHIFKDTITYDMLDRQAGTTPVQLASNIALEFGLSFAETMNLAESIERQIMTYHYVHNSYTPPIPAIDTATGGLRDTPSTRVAVAWHGQVTSQTASPGCEVPLPKEVVRSARDRRSVVAQVPPSQKTPRSANSAQPSKKKKISKVPMIKGMKSEVPMKAAKNQKVPIIKSTPTKNNNETKPAPSKIAKNHLEAKYRNEIRDRLEEYCRKTTNDDKSNEKSTNPTSTVCHVCREETENLIQGTCGVSDHALCPVHLEELRGRTKDLQNVDTVCPVCCLRCTCRVCTKKLGQLSKLFKRRCESEGLSPKDLPYETFRDTVQSWKNQSKQTKSKSSVKRVKPAEQDDMSVEPKRVLKVPVADFPFEMCNGQDMDPGTKEDYSAVYTEKGAEFPELSSVNDVASVPPAFLPVARSSTEDGNLDYCDACGTPGTMHCCDYCPRAFHPKCLENPGTAEISPWMCPRCCQEKRGFPEDLVDGATVIDELRRDYGSDDIEVHILAKIYDMVVRLMKYDFGEMFSKPVEGAEGYNEVIDTPMDLGTVLANITSVTYLKRVGGSTQNAIIQSLKDIELVWQNCFKFNREGSAVYRKAEVQRRRAHAIQMKSFDNLLSNAIKQELDKYRSKFNQKYAAPRFVEKNTRPTIKGTVRGVHIARSIGVLDPDSRRVVKIYSSQETAMSALRFLVSLKHDYEYHYEEIENKVLLRRLFREGSNDPSLLLFGYRWLHMEDLRNGRVKFDGSKCSDGDGGDKKNDPSEVNGRVNVNGVPESLGAAEKKCDENELSCGVSKAEKEMHSIKEDTRNGTVAADSSVQPTKIENKIVVSSEENEKPKMDREIKYFTHNDINGLEVDKKLGYFPSKSLALEKTQGRLPPCEIDSPRDSQQHIASNENDPNSLDLQNEICII